MAGSGLNVLLIYGPLERVSSCKCIEQRSCEVFAHGRGRELGPWLTRCLTLMRGIAESNCNSNGEHHVKVTLLSWWWADITGTEFS